MIRVSRIAWAGSLLLALAVCGPSPQAAEVQRNFNLKKPVEDAPPPEEPKRKRDPKREAPPVTSESPWQVGLNEFFQTDFTMPSPEERLAALVAHLDRQTISGVPPELAYQQFEAMIRDLRNRVPKNNPELDAVSALFKNLTTWVALEQAYTAGDTNVLRPLVALVQSQAALDVNGDQEQWARVIQIIEEQKLFAPAVIVFGATVLPYRRVNTPQDLRPMEVLASPEYTDKPFESTATFEFLSAPGPFFRIDFDTVGTQTAEVSISEDGIDFVPIDIDIRRTIEGLKGPIILKTTQLTKHLRIKVTSEPETAVLRNIRLFAFKAPAEAASKSAAEAPVVDGSFKEAGWPRQAQIYGMVSGETFAEAETTTWMCHTRDALFLGIYARERRMDTMAAAMTDRDAPLWEEESVEVIVHKPGQPPFRLVVNPLGAQYDSFQDESLWDGEWTAATQRFAAGWSAEMRIPFATIGGAPDATGLNLQVIRHRANVKRETSQWAPGDGAVGRVTFN